MTFVTQDKAALSLKPNTPKQAMGQRHTQHIKALDGLRGVAILMVLTHHFIPYHPTHSVIGKLLNGIAGIGYSGVDLFFVLSGFLITGILFDAKQDEHYFRTFYARRTLRIFPLYYLMTFLCLVIIPRLNILQDAVPSGGGWWWWFYVSNFHYAFKHNLSEGWLNPFWSLAVEEHFYLLWPTVIYLLNRKKAILFSVACIIIATLSRAAFIAYGNHTAPYVLTPCRIDALASGALVALLARGPISLNHYLPRIKVLCLVTGAIGFAIALWRHGIVWDSIMQLTGFPLVAAFYACLLIIVCIPGPGDSRVIRKAFENKLLTSFGKYSYGIYVFHSAVHSLVMRVPFLTWKLSAAHFTHLSDILNFLTLTAVSFAVAYASWHLFERHFLKLKRFFTYVPRKQAMASKVSQ